jgi:hypothetical protein
MKSERNANNYFGVNHFQDNYTKGFEYKDCSQYSSLTEWLNNTFIAMNENSSIRQAHGNRFSIMDKRLGITYSLMGGFMTTEKQNELMNDEQACINFLTDYYYKNNGRTELVNNAEKEIRQYSDMEIIVTDTPIPNNHLFAVRGEFCDFYETSKYVMAYLKPNYKTLNLKTDLPYLARLSKNFDEFCEYWQMELDKLRRLADDTFYKFKDDYSVLINEMNKADKKHFYNYHTN